METIDWHTLRSFVAVAEEGHITRAAERLNTRQPPLSLRIGALERRLAVKLFIRKPRGVELTAAGQALLVHARALIDQHAKAVDAVQRAGRGELGRLNIATVPTGPMHPLMPLSVRRFREQYPEASVTLEECLRDELLQRLRQEQVDVAFMRSLPEDPSGLAVAVLLHEPTAYWMAANMSFTSGVFSFLSAFASIWRIRSLVTERLCPTCSSVQA